jgi:hypothetical protein
MQIYKLRRRTYQSDSATKRSSNSQPLAERIRRYLDKMPSAISGQNGHRQTFFVTRTLVHGFALSKEAALPFLREYNQRCQPPWNEEELEYKVKSAIDWKPNKAEKPRGHLL